MPSAGLALVKAQASDLVAPTVVEPPAFNEEDTDMAPRTAAALRYLHRCRIAHDLRPTLEILCEVVSERDGAEILAAIRAEERPF